MPEQPLQKHRLSLSSVSRSLAPIPYAELAVASNFSFLRGASHPEELMAQAAALGHHAIALTDLHSFAGIVRAHQAAKDANIPFLVGCRVEVKDALGLLAPGAPGDLPALALLLYPTTRVAYGRICRLLTLGKSRAPKGSCYLTLQDVLEHQEASLAILLPPPFPFCPVSISLGRLKDAFDDDRFSLAVTHLYDCHDAPRFAALVELSRAFGIPLVATNDVHYHVPERRALQDVLTCVRLGSTLEQAGFALFANAERHLKTPQEMARLFVDYPQAIARTVAIADRAGGFSLDQLKYEYPSEVSPVGKDPMEHLIELTFAGARQRYPDSPELPASLRARLEHEFSLIRDLHYERYFLTVHDIVEFARGRHILCQGRGAAANSAVCYCLGITAVDPTRIDLLVERFISRERDEPPDIDVDFEHERREEVIQYIYQKYGRHRAALTGEVITYRRRSALRDVGKTLGLSLDTLDRLAKAGDWWDPTVMTEAQLRQLGLNPHDPTLRLTVQLATELLGFPRHLSQHVGGFVISQTPLSEIVPIENAAMPERTFIEWDKDDIDTLGILKIDILALGMLTAIRKAMDMVNAWASLPPNPGIAIPGLAPPYAHSPLQLHTIPAEDPAVYSMLCNADSVGVFQVESRAQMSMLPRLQPRCYYDLVIEVAIVRPGPIQGGMVHPYLRRRGGQEAISYPSEAVKKVLQRTLGIPLFQEQAMRLVMVAAGFTAGQADGLRRAMAAWKRKGNLMEKYVQQILAGMLEHGYTPAFAHTCLEQIKGFSEYGFPESHAASFALLVYVSAWLKKYHPAAFAAALLNSQPMGFYAPAQLVRDAQEHAVRVLPIDVNYSQWDATLEGEEETCRWTRAIRGSGDTVIASSGAHGAWPCEYTGPWHPGRGFPSTALSPSTDPLLRLGFNLVKGLSQKDAAKIPVAVAAHGAFGSIAALWRASGVRLVTLRRLAEADAFTSMGLTRQSALWAIEQLRDTPLPIFDQLCESLEISELPAPLPAVSPQRLVIHDYAAVGLSLKAHPLSFTRPRLTELGILTAAGLKTAPVNKRCGVAGLVLVRQRPATAGGVLFLTLEDETGSANLIVRPDIYQRFRRPIRHAVILLAYGRVERQGLVTHLLVERAADLRESLRAAPSLLLESLSRDFH